MPSAARQGDLTAHGGVVIGGFSQVIIEGAPAARAGDGHVCPQCNPGTPPPPHVGGPIAQGSATVLIGGAAAARVGDICVCMGPPDCIVQGANNVIIGDGAGSGGGAGNGPGKQAQAAVFTALVGTPGESRIGKHWIEYQVLDETGHPVNGVNFQCQHPGHSDDHIGITNGNGSLKRAGFSQQGDSNLQLIHITEVNWSTELATQGETVELSATLIGVEDGKDVSFCIYTMDNSGSSREVYRAKSTVSGEQARIEWTCGAEAEAATPEEFTESHTGLFYFEIQSEAMCARSALLRYVDWINIEVANAKDHVGKHYQLLMSDGSSRQGTVSQSGIISLKDITPGPIHIVLEGGYELYLGMGE